MSLQYTREKFVECPTCAAKPGSPPLCRECLERRELWEVAERLRRSHGLRTYIRDLVKLCLFCNGSPNPECPEHGR
jgi:hypothetical protein